MNMGMEHQSRVALLRVIDVVVIFPTFKVSCTLTKGNTEADQNLIASLDSYNGP
jgi:hypothetical protein